MLNPVAEWSDCWTHWTLSNEHGHKLHFTTKEEAEPLYQLWVLRHKEVTLVPEDLHWIDGGLIPETKP